MLYEFPLLHGDSLYGGDDPSTNWVVFYIYMSNPDTNPMDNGACCDVMNHDGAPKSEFVLCPVLD